MPSIHIENENKIISCLPDDNLLEVLRRQGIDVGAACGGKGTCGKCKVLVEACSIETRAAEWIEKEDTGTESDTERAKGLASESVTSESEIAGFRTFGFDASSASGIEGMEASSLEAEGSFPVTETEKRFLTREEIGKGIRLACQVRVREDLRVTIPAAKSEIQALTDGFLPEYPKDNLGDSGEYGIAVDIGTTTIACCLVDLASGALRRRDSGLNPQTAYGLDVLTRISYEQSHPADGVTVLQSAVVSGLNEIIRRLCRAEGIEPAAVTRISVSANCTMMHMLLGVNAESIGRTPFRPVFTEARELEASEIGLITGNAALYCLPSVSSYIGADIVAGAYVCGLRECRGNVMFIDIGTNGELVLSQSGQMNSCSCAAGPALEGMNIRCGMRGEDGAIQHVVIEPSGIQLDVIGNTEPRGICGSGILSALRELLRIGVVRKSGVFIRKERIPEGDFRADLVQVDEEGRRYAVLYSGNSHPWPIPASTEEAAGARYEAEVSRNTENTGKPERPWNPAGGSTEICVTQKDIRQLQLAKGAILSGLRVLLRKAALTPEELDEVIVAGQFGAHVGEEDLTGTGILPGCLKDRIRYVGNTALTGAVMTLLSKEVRASMEELAGMIQYTELGETKDYTFLLAECMEFPDA